MIEIRWHGRGGQGAFTAAKILGAAASLYENKYALSFPSFGPERRGAPVSAFTKIDTKPIINRSEVKLCDYIVFLDETLFELSCLQDLKEKGKIILNSANAQQYKKYDNIVTVDADAVAMEILKMPITNTGMLGVLAGVSKAVSLASVLSAAADYLPKSILNKNLAVIEKLFQFSKEASYE